jgi:pheromone shutdown protein TraB
VYEAECTPWVGGPIVVAVVGAAHVDGIVHRWNASLG